MNETKEETQFQISDRRFSAKDGSLLEQATVPEQKLPSYVEELKARTDLAERKLREKLKKLDEENEAFRERLTRENEKRLERKKLDFLQDFLEIVDNFERALQAAEKTSSLQPGQGEIVPESLKEGVRLNLELLMAKLKGGGIEPINVLHKPFDPHEAEAVGMVAVNNPDLDQHVVEIVKNGYHRGEDLLRPALVRVDQYQAKGQPKGSET